MGDSQTLVRLKGALREKIGWRGWRGTWKGRKRPNLDMICRFVATVAGIQHGMADPVLACGSVARQLVETLQSEG